MGWSTPTIGTPVIPIYIPGIKTYTMLIAILRMGRI